MRSGNELIRSFIVISGKPFSCTRHIRSGAAATPEEGGRLNRPYVLLSIVTIKCATVLRCQENSGGSCTRQLSLHKSILPGSRHYDTPAARTVLVTLCVTHFAWRAEALPPSRPLDADVFSRAHGWMECSRAEANLIKF
ncbi:hypothetical protein BIW11_03025 [Tropilaelaps mercedesae]|uniref:Uncharacterized protein n=1 Tax=Tropilaelaps mercedesae TaxID=418985 RepID=A0A1V9XT60_9ACAR|nr:hypothetical protein BIW11_03025 [Tropilaelaps mercedesae]